MSDEIKKEPAGQELPIEDLEKTSGGVHHGPIPTWYEMTHPAPPPPPPPPPTPAK